MKNPPITRQSASRLAGGFLAALLATSSAATAADATIDGYREELESYTRLATQTVASSFAGNSLANLSAKQEGGSLLVHMAGRTADNAIILFLDTKPGGRNVITNNVITSGGEEYTINNLGASTTAGLTFETGFEADYAIRIYGAGSNAYVNVYNLVSGVRRYAGNSGPGEATDALITTLRTVWNDYVLADYSTADLGVEMKLPLAALGVPLGSAQPVKLTALLVNGGSDYASNQVLGPVNRTADIAGGIRTLNLQTEPGTQTLTIVIDNNDTDGDGIPNSTDPDDDNDGLLDTEETNDGIYLSPTATGTNPLVADTDGDGGSDFDEVRSPYHFGFLTNPNIPNYHSIAVPGSYTDPQWQVDGTGGTGMTRVGTSLEDQYKWRLNYNFRTLGTIEYKFAADGMWTHSWGDGGNNISSFIRTTGFHTLTFNNAMLARTLTRTVFPDLASYLAAYGVTAGSDDDDDGLTAEQEFAKNTDPLNYDTDGDTEYDDTDADPLLAARDIVFSVDMSVQQSLGNFNPATDTVAVDFFSGAAGALPDLSLTPAGNGIWTGTLSNFSGPLGASFGEYKFRHTHPDAPDGGYEGAINNRTFNLGPANVTQVLDTVYFNDVSSTGTTYAAWAAANANGQTAGQDFDNDGVKNGVEYFMGQTGSTFTPGPTLTNRVFSIPHAAGATGVTWRLLTSTNLVTWTDVTSSATDSGGVLTYTLPAGSPRQFIRLEVTAP